MRHIILAVLLTVSGSTLVILRHRSSQPPEVERYTLMSMFKRQSSIPTWKLGEQIATLATFILVIVIVVVIIIGFALLFSGTIPINHSPTMQWQSSGSQMMKHDFHSERFNIYPYA